MTNGLFLLRVREPPKMTTAGLIKSQLMHMSAEKQETLLKLAILSTAAVLCMILLLNLDLEHCLIVSYSPPC